MKNPYKQKSKGFTIIELVVVIVVIGILAAITFVFYTGVQARAVDASVQSDIDAMNSSQLQYGLDTNGSALAYYSGSGRSATLNFTPNSGNVIDVVTTGKDYCIRGYNKGGTKNSINNAFTKESSPGVCGQITASAAAIADSNNNGNSGWLSMTQGGSGHTCAINMNNLTYCWGGGTDGQLGNNAILNSNVPVAVDTSGVLSGKTTISVSSGYRNTCAIASDNKAYCWGYNADGQLGNNSNLAVSSPVAVDTSGVLNGKTIKAITNGLYHTCAIASDNQIYCWGRGINGQLGNNSAVNSNVPLAVDTSGVLSGKTIKSVAAGTGFTCAIASDDQVYCWGLSSSGQLGYNSTTQSLIPVAIDRTGGLSGKTIKFISANQSFACAIASDNNAYCWGSNAFGQSGNNAITQSLIPLAVDTTGVLSGKTIKSISAAYNNTCAIASDDKAYCWGKDSSGELGNNSIIQSNVPVAVDTSGVLNGKTIISIAARSSHACAIASDNQAYCWGTNNMGQLGNGTNTQSLVPVAATTAP